MNKEQRLVIDTIKENNSIPLAISESNNVANTQDFLSTLIEEKYHDSLAYSICEVLPVKSALGVIYATTRSTNEDFKVVKRDIYSKIYTVNTGFTREVWEDMKSMFGKNAGRSAGKVLSGISAQEENFTLILKMDTDAEVKPALAVNTSNAGWVTSQITKKVAESVIEMNRIGYKTTESFCVLSGKWAAYFLGTAEYVKSDTDSNDKCSLFVGRYGNTDYYVNPFPPQASEFTTAYDFDFTIDPAAVDYCYVGLKSDTPGLSSMVFTPYTYETKFVTDPDTMNSNLFIFNRYGLEFSPLHEPLRQKGLIHKFELTEI